MNPYLQHRRKAFRQTGDPFWANVVFLLQGGANGSKPATDQSQYAHALTWNGNAAFSTAQSPFAGGSSLALDGNDDWVSAEAAVLAMATDSFTFETWIRGTSAADDGIFESRSGASGALNGFTLTAFSSTVIRVFTNSVLLTHTSSWLNTWQHIAVTRQGDTWRLYVQGSESAVNTQSFSLTNQSIVIGAGKYTGTSTPTASAGFNGNIGPVRITKGIARYTANFTPPTAPFPTGP